MVLSTYSDANDITNLKDNYSASATKAWRDDAYLKRIQQLMATVKNDTEVARNRALLVLGVHTISMASPRLDFAVYLLRFHRVLVLENDKLEPAPTTCRHRFGVTMVAGFSL